MFVQKPFGNNLALDPQHSKISYFVKNTFKEIAGSDAKYSRDTKVPDKHLKSF